MASPTVIIDLSPIVRLDDRNDWRHVEMVVKAWREQRDLSAVFYGVADNSLWHVMNDLGNRQLKQWKKRGMARSVPWADPTVLEMAHKNPDAAVITTDLYRDLRTKHPWLQGTNRIMKPVISGTSLEFAVLDFSPIPAYEVSWRAEEADLKPKGMLSPEARQALWSEWACTNVTCKWGAAPVIDDDPSYRDGRVCCPACGFVARRAGSRENTREIVVLLGEDEVDRIPIAEGTSLTVGRGRGDDRYDVRGLLEDQYSALVSRDQIRLTNQAGRLLVEELGSKNGSDLIRKGGQMTQLTAGVLQTVLASDRISLAAGALQIRPSGRKRARGQYAPDLTTAPWLR